MAADRGLADDLRDALLDVGPLHGGLEAPMEFHGRLARRVFWTVTRRVFAEYVRVSLRVMTISNG